MMWSAQVIAKLTFSAMKLRLFDKSESAKVQQNRTKIYFFLDYMDTNSTVNHKFYHQPHTYVVQHINSY